MAVEDQDVVTMTVDCISSDDDDDDDDVVSDSQIVTMSEEDDITVYPVSTVRGNRSYLFHWMKIPSFNDACTFKEYPYVEIVA